MKHIETKEQMYSLYVTGALGNKLRSWNGWGAWHTHNLIANHPQTTPTVGLRYKGAQGGKWSAYAVPWDSVKETVAQWTAEGADPQLIVIGETAPDENLTIQGEVQRSFRGLELRYNTVKASMREAMKAPLYAHGLRAKLLLEAHLTPDSLQDIYLLLDTYDTHPKRGVYESHTVEFSAYSHCLGSIPHRNTLVWECRSYIWLLLFFVCGTFGCLPT